MFVRRAARIEGSDEIDIDDALERVCRHADHRRWKIPSRAADQNIDLTELIASLLHGCLDSRIVAHIHGTGFRRSVRRPDAGSSRVEFFLLAANQHDLRSMPGKS